MCSCRWMDVAEPVMNTTEQPVVRRETAHSFSAGMTYLSCPVFGRPDAVAARKCIMVLSGPEAAKAKVRPLLEPLGRAVLGGAFSATQKPFSAVCQHHVGYRTITSLCDRAWCAVQTPGTRRCMAAR